MGNKEAIQKRIDELKDELVDLSKVIHDKPELIFKEYSAAENICRVLSSHGFKVKRNIAGLETAFIAEYDCGEPGPTLAFLAEYDALPEIGHGCGHNLIATMAVGAALGLKEVSKNLKGKIQVIGTPGEEGGGGKVIMCKEGVFDQVDFALMLHPSTHNMICRGGLATRGVFIEYFGKSAHSSSPESGINALQAVIQTFNGIDAMRPLMPLKSNVNGIIKDGGKADNVIPDYSSCEFSVRADTVGELKSVVKRIERVVDSVNVLIGTTSKITKSLVYAERYVNHTIDEKLKENMETLGEVMLYPDPKMKYGSSDIGNVSLVVPAIHSYIRITEKDVNSHSIDFTHAAITDLAHEQMVKGAKGMAMTALDILSSKELQEEIIKEFEERVPKYEKDELD